MELIWLTSIFSDIKSVYGNVSKVSKLDADIDDVYQTIIEFKHGVLCTMNIDVISIPSFRETKILGEKGTIVCDFNKGIIEINKGKKWRKMHLQMGKVAKGYLGSTPPDTPYEEEIESFMNVLRKNKKYKFSLNDELKILKIVDKIETSSRKGKKIILD
jgi:predicted dehydrogenase